MRAGRIPEVVVALMLFVLLGTTGAPSVAFAQAKEPPRERVTYEDRYTFKHGTTYTYDPWIWVYTREFAERFAMPDQWIDPGLKGALALAFRMSTIAPMTCGLGGNETACWPSQQCQLDVYYDTSVPIPWVHPDIERDLLMRGIASEEYLKDLNDNKRIRGYVPKDPSNGWLLVLGSTVFSIPAEKLRSPLEASVAYFDRTYQIGVGLIGFADLSSPCPAAVGNGQIAFYDLEGTALQQKGKLRDPKPVHVIEIPRQFLQRANSIYLKTRREKEEMSKRLLQEMRNQPSR